jgi:hypothetical protein
VVELLEVTEVITVQLACLIQALVVVEQVVVLL